MRPADVIAMLGIGAVCLPTAAWLMPNIEQSRTEARIGQAYLDVKRLHESLAEKAPTQPEALPERDPWGEPYRVVPTDGGFRVVSSGPNQVSPPEGLDEDDIDSDRTDSSAKAKQRQFLLAIFSAVGLWVALSVAYLRTRREPTG
jgi:hypothetical protein